MQSGNGKTKSWILEFISRDASINPMMGWESSTDTLSEVKLEFENKEQAINYAIKNNIKYTLLKSKNRKVVKKSYSDNFTS
jgi:hypothetical protein